MYDKYISVEKTYISAKNQYEQSEILFRKGMAGILALNLNEGEPCPYVAQLIILIKHQLKVKCQVKKS